MSYSWWNPLSWWYGNVPEGTSSTGGLEVPPVPISEVPKVEPLPEIPQVEVLPVSVVPVSVPEPKVEAPLVVPVSEHPKAPESKEPTESKKISSLGRVVFVPDSLGIKCHGKVIGETDTQIQVHFLFWGPASVEWISPDKVTEWLGTS